MDQQKGKAETSQSRRRLLKGSASAPVLSLLVSRPVLGAPHSCSPSGFASMNDPDFAGSVHGEEGPCSGNSPGFWKNHWDVWETTPYSPGMRTDSDDKLIHNQEGNHVPDKWKGVGNTKFSDAFGTPIPGQDPDLTLMEVLRDNAVRTSLEYHAISALLNASSADPSINIYGDMLTPDIVRALYLGGIGGGYDTGSGIMDPGEIILFLETVAG